MVCSWCCFVLRLVSSNLLRCLLILLHSSSSSFSSFLLRSHFFSPSFSSSSVSLSLYVSVSLLFIHSPFLLCVLCKYSFAKLSSHSRATTRLQRVRSRLNFSQVRSTNKWLLSTIIAPLCVETFARVYFVSLVCLAYELHREDRYFCL